MVSRDGKVGVVKQQVNNMPHGQQSFEECKWGLAPRISNVTWLLKFSEIHNSVLHLYNS